MFHGFGVQGWWVSCQKKWTYPLKRDHFERKCSIWTNHQFWNIRSFSRGVTSHGIPYPTLWEVGKSSTRVGTSSQEGKGDTRKMNRSFLSNKTGSYRNKTTKTKNVSFPMWFNSWPFLCCSWRSPREVTIPKKVTSRIVRSFIFVGIRASWWNIRFSNCSFSNESRRSHVGIGVLAILQPRHPKYHYLAKL